MKELVSKPELCNECMKCERNCPKNAIRVINGVPIFCMHCTPERAPCLNICPEDAIEEVDGAIVILKENCIGCGLCRDACPIGVMNMDEKGIANKCDLCIGEEEAICVLSCPTQALRSDSEELISGKQDKITKELERLKNIMKY